MSRSKIGKKLQPAKRALKSFSNKVQSKLHKLNIPRTIKATYKLFLSTLHSLSHLIPSRARRPLTRRRSYAAFSTSYNVHSKIISALSIDKLFVDSASSSSSMHLHANKIHTQGETSKGKEVIGMENMCIESSGLDTIEDAWKAVVAKSPQLQVDEKAEEFISKFYEDMRLQKERSLLEFQERLARSA